MVHQIKTPLTPIMGWADALQDPQIMGNLTPQQLRAITVISYNAGKLDNLLENLLDVQKLSKKEMIYDVHNFNTNDIFSNLSRYYEKVVSDNKIRLLINQEHPIIIKGDKRRIEQIFTNLIDYLIDSLPKEDGKIELNVDSKEKHVKFKINYNGCKIPMEIRQAITRTFSDSDFDFEKAYNDNYIGLKICKGLVEGMGGTIWIENDEKNTSFYFTVLNKITR